MYPGNTTLKAEGEGMAKRPLFVPHTSGPPWVRAVELEFQWYPGFSQSQARRSIASLHQAAGAAGFNPVLEISSKADDSLGRQLSAFNLQLPMPNGSRISVENAFQGSKVFADGGPYTDLYEATPREAKRDPRIRGDAPLVKFSYFGVDWPLQPITLFYDWLYLRALDANRLLAERLPSFEGFTDIAFNPDRSLNCQARSAALYVALHGIAEMQQVLESSRAFLQIVASSANMARRGGTSDQISLW
jgi:hypothetical protein